VQKEELIARLDAPMKFQMVTNSTAIINSHDLDINDLLDISFHKKKEIAFRAAWMLEYIMIHDPHKFSPYVGRLLDLLPGQTNHSAMRHYTKMIAMLTARNADPVYKDLSATIDFEPVIEVLFGWLLESGILVAAKVHCMQSLANLAPRYQWLKDDLRETIDHLTDTESIAFFARAKMVKKQLAQLK